MGLLRVGHDWVTSLSHIGEGNGNPLQCSCLENPGDGGAWWVAVYGVAQSWTRLKRLSRSSSSMKSWVLWSVPTCGCAKAEEALSSWGTPRRTHIWLHPGYLIASSLWDLTSKHCRFLVDLVRALVQASWRKFQSRPYSVVWFFLLRIMRCLSWKPGVLKRC